MKFSHFSSTGDSSNSLSSSSSSSSSLCSFRRFYGPILIRAIGTHKSSSFFINSFFLPWIGYYSKLQQVHGINRVLWLFFVGDDPCLFTSESTSRKNQNHDMPSILSFGSLEQKGKRVKNHMLLQLNYQEVINTRFWRVHG